MSYLTDHPDLMLALIAKLVSRLGGQVTVRDSDHPTEAFDLKSRLVQGSIELILTDGKQPS